MIRMSSIFSSSTCEGEFLFESKRRKIFDQPRNLRTEANQTFDLWCGQFERRALAHDLPAAWNAPTAEPRTKQRLKVRVDHVDVVLMPAEFASALAERPN